MSLQSSDGAGRVLNRMTKVCAKVGGTTLMVYGTVTVKYE